MPYFDLITYIPALLIIHILGILLGIHAIMHTRTSQGSIAWVIALVLAPVVSIPFYLILGRNRFSGYIKMHRKRFNTHLDIQKIYAKLQQKIKDHTLDEEDTHRATLKKTLSELAQFTWTENNSVKILINGDETFAALFNSIKNAKKYILVEFFIIKDDTLGDDFQKLLISKAQEGVAIHLIFDEIGSHKLPRSYIEAFKKEPNIHISPFSGKRRWISNIVQINFRNHRKIVVVDGTQAFIGGLNVGNEYIGLSSFGHWRDTFIKMEGPAVLSVQMTFLEDWIWAAKTHINNLNWEPQPQEENKEILILPSGPADHYATWKLAIIALANAAEKRLWIASPYFVPDPAVVSALQIAALRGVDIRILLPVKPDHILVWLSCYTYFEEILPVGIKIFRYTDGFLHEKALLVDDDLSVITTANFDNRSMRLNFEIGGFILNKETAREVKNMFLHDFNKSKETHLDDFLKRSFPFRLACRMARLLAPVQ